jgi:phosphonate transport system substrate-binding protein
MPLSINGETRHKTLMLSRRWLLGALGGAVLGAATAGRAYAPSTMSFGLTPVFLDSDIQLLAMLQQYLERQVGCPVSLVKRRTYQEITALLLSGQLDAASVCDFPYVQHQDKLALLGVPLYRHQPLYETYIVVNTDCPARSFDETRGTVHAFSDPDSTSGYLVTRWLLALRQTTPAAFFRKSFFTYGHRNVIKAVADGLAESGSIDGYVWDVMNEREPEITRNTRIIYRSEFLCFPPVVGLQTTSASPISKAISDALLSMTDDPLGREILGILQLDGFTMVSPEDYRTTAEKWRVVREQV